MRLFFIRGGAKLVSNATPPASEPPIRYWSVFLCYLVLRPDVRRHGCGLRVSEIAQLCLAVGEEGGGGEIVLWRITRVCCGLAFTKYLHTLNRKRRIDLVSLQSSNPAKFTKVLDQGCR
jgi:hypothetical protein